MENNMILSASGWRKVFAISGDEQDKAQEISGQDKAISIAAAKVFLDFIKERSGQENPVLAVGTDARPTGKEIADSVIRLLVKDGAIVQYSGITAAPEIMAYAKKLDGFIYISASHNPVGHNGIKFGTNDGGVLNAQDNARLVKEFKKITEDKGALEKLVQHAQTVSASELRGVYSFSDSAKHNALSAYKSFVSETIADTPSKDYQADFLGMLDKACSERPVGVVCDFNGSARSKSIDREYFQERGIGFFSINDDEIAHEIIPEAENLVHVSKAMDTLHQNGHREVILGYMPDCDGDRGNLVYWDEKKGRSVILKAQEVFSLSVLAELTYSIWKNEGSKDFRPAVCVNCPTSMRIEEIAGVLGAKVFRAEVGEANVVNLAREKRAEGYTVRILGEGSNGGTITYPSAVRDPLNTIFAIIKLLRMTENGPYEIWCRRRGIDYSPDFTLSDVLESLPKYTTTGVSEPRAILKVKEKDHSRLKAGFQKAFEADWKKKSAGLKKKYKISEWEAVITNGTTEVRSVADFSKSGKGGLKIILTDSKKNPLAFIWMRGSGTEPVFRIMCDVKGDNPAEEKELLEWETELIKAADK